MLPVLEGWQIVVPTALAEVPANHGSSAGSTWNDVWFISSELPRQSFVSPASRGHLVEPAAQGVYHAQHPFG